MIEDKIKAIGTVKITTEWKDGKIEEKLIKNTVLNTGRYAMVNCLTNQIGDSFNFYITRMVFGDGGTESGVKKYVDAGRNGLFGVTRLSKPVISSVNQSVGTQAIFTSVIKFDEAVGLTLNEMALQMKSGDFYSMTTFPDINKTEEMQIIFGWYLNFV